MKTGKLIALGAVIGIVVIFAWWKFHGGGTLVSFKQALVRGVTGAS
jgi:hypothetical protein